MEESIENDEGDIHDSAKKTKKGKPAKKTKKKANLQPEHIDYVLDFIIERKTADDLAASIVDGRYEE
jgi:ERCC4-type nuclease